MKLSKEERRGLNAIIDQELRRAKQQVGGLDPRPKAVTLVAKELNHSFWGGLKATLLAGAYEDFIRRAVNDRVNNATQEFQLRENVVAGNGNLPEVLFTDTRQRTWIKPTGPGGKPTPKLVAHASRDDHHEIAERREQQALNILRKSRWHKGNADYADAHGITENVAQTLFEIEAPGNGNS